MRNHRGTEQALARELVREERGRAMPFEVETHRGVDMLPGMDNTGAQRLAAQEAARCIAQIRDVTSDQEVMPLTGHECLDTNIARQVQAALQWDVLVARAVHDL